ncbi:MAG: hypothetical protein U0638_09500 [Phycisphaerales bacterium]
MKSPKSPWFVPSLLVALVGTAHAKPPLQIIDTADAIPVIPLRVAPASMVNGKLVVGEWSDYSGVSTRSPVWCGWDAFGRDWGVGATSAPIYANYCGFANPSDRYFWGWGYNCPLFVDDVYNTPSSGVLVDEINFQWTWEGSGNCDIMVLLSDNQAQCSDGDPLSHTYSTGLIFHFGTLPGSPGTLYAANFSGLVAGGFNLALPPAVGSYLVGIGDVSTGTFQPQPWPTQSMLWGSKSLMTPPFNTAPYIEGSGDHTSESWDDDSPIDLNFSSNECYDNTFGCPSALNHMIAFGVAQPPCPPCPPTTVTKHYMIKGNAKGTPWSWGILETPLGLLTAHGTNPGVTGNTCTLANALVSQINTYAAQDLCSPATLQATVMSCQPNWPWYRARIRISAQVCPGSSFNLYTGNGNVDPTCLVPTWPAVGCTFNPEIVEIVPSGQDCNGNGEDDMFDIADGVSNDFNNDGIPDECQCIADFNSDGFVNGNDFDLFAFLFEAGDLGADVNSDGFVNGDDYDAFAIAFDSGC